MAGGSGERFWPLSRRKNPKQLLKLFSDHSLLGETVLRLQGLLPAERIFILTNEAQVEPTRQALPDFPPEQIVAEPAKRDTAPAAALATAIARHHDPDAIVALLPADQLIKDTGAFQKQLNDCFHQAFQEPVLMTIAISPHYPSTGFGYLKMADDEQKGPLGTKIKKVVQFVEKPDLTTAQAYLEDGSYAWNAGMFVWKNSTFTQVASQFQPDLSEFILNFPGLADPQFMADHFPKLTKISVDYAIMEKADRVEAAIAEFDWDDVGSWTSLTDHLPQDSDGNTLSGQAFTLESKDNILFSSGRAIAACGVSDLIIVETADSVLVCHKSQAQQIKALLPQLPPELKE